MNNRKFWVLQEQASDGEGGSGAAGVSGAAGASGAPSGVAGASGANIDHKVGLWPEDWRKQLAGDDAAVAKRLERFAAPGEIWRSYRALEQRMSTGELKSVLPKDATPEQKATWRAENGIPDAPEKYDLNLGNGLVVGENDKPMVEDFAKAAHAADMHPNQFKAALAWYYDWADKQAATAAEKDKAALSAGDETLRAEWGPDYKPNLNRIQALMDLAPQGVKEQMMGGRLANGIPFMSDPKTLSWLVGLAREIDPATTVVPNAGARAPAAIDEEIAEIEKLMRTDRKAYNADQAKQARLRDLYTARDKIKAKAA